MASFLGIGRPCYANYESGEREAPIEILEKVCELMGCELSVLFEEDTDVVENMLVCAFRAENLSDKDVDEVAAFKNIVMNYLKMKKLNLETAEYFAIKTKNNLGIGIKEPVNMKTFYLAEI